jgi:hypothetical protein
MHDMFHLIHLIRLRSSLCRRCGRGRMARHASVGADRSVGGGGQRVRYHSDEYRLRLHIATEVRDHDAVQEGGGGGNGEGEGDDEDDDDDAALRVACCEMSARTRSLQRRCAQPRFKEPLAG